MLKLKMLKEIEIENKIKTEYRNGDFTLCEACGEVILGEVYDFGGKICKRCYEEVELYQKK